MSNWISSKLKAAETILQQIDQQAAESLKKNEKPHSPSSSSLSSSSHQIQSKKLDPAPTQSLKYQLPPKKATNKLTPSGSPSPNPTPPDVPTPERRSTSDPSVIDWTELLSSPNPIGFSEGKESVRKKVIRKPPVAVPVVASKREVVQETVKKEESRREDEKNEEEEEEEDEDGSSSSGSDDSDYDSEEERRMREERRKRREQFIAEKAKAAALKAIKEREDEVARLEGEKESLEKILEEREKQQAKEVNES